MVFLAGVANATIMDGDKIVATANTLLDSSITIGVSLEEVRAGNGAKLYGKYAHTSTFDLKLTDAMFNLEYLAMNTGSEVEIGGDVMVTESATVAAGSLTYTLEKTAVPFWTNGGIVAFAKKQGTDDEFMEYAVNSNAITLPSAGKYCIRYMYNNSDASRMVIAASFIPKTLSIILEANLYSGGSCDVETSTLAGKLQIKVYRFMLNGSQELSMTSTGVSQTAIEGSALASGCEGCDNDGAYAEIIQVMDNEHWYDKASGIMLEDAYRPFAVGDNVNIEPACYAYFNNATPKLIPNNEITYSFSADGTGLTWNNGRITGTAQTGTAILKAVVTSKPELDAVLTVVVGE